MGDTTRAVSDLWDTEGAGDEWNWGAGCEMMLHFPTLELFIEPRELLLLLVELVVFSPSQFPGQTRTLKF